MKSDIGAMYYRL